MLTMSAASRPSRKPIKKLASISPRSPRYGGASLAECVMQPTKVRLA
jgi:hypothetical protein